MRIKQHCWKCNYRTGL